MATGTKVNARKARESAKQAALGQIVRTLQGAFGEYVRSQMAAGNAPAPQLMAQRPPLQDPQGGTVNPVQEAPPSPLEIAASVANNNLFNNNPILDPAMPGTLPTGPGPQPGRWWGATESGSLVDANGVPIPVRPDSYVQPNYMIPVGQHRVDPAFVSPGPMVRYEDGSMGSVALPDPGFMAPTPAEIIAQLIANAPRRRA